MTAPGSMSPCTIEKDVLDAMKKFRRVSNKATMAILRKLMKEKKDFIRLKTEKYVFSLFIVRCDMKTNQVVIDKELKVSVNITHNNIYRPVKIHCHICTFFLLCFCELYT